MNEEWASVIKETKVVRGPDNQGVSKQTQYCHILGVTIDGIMISYCIY